MQFESFTTFNLAILVLALGNWLNRKIKILRDFNIPEPVTSGLLVCVVTAMLYAFAGFEISFTLATRDFLFLYFFASIGLNSDIKTLWAGGIPLLILVSLTIVFMLLQNDHETQRNHGNDQRRDALQQRRLGADVDKLTLWQLEGLEAEPHRRADRAKGGRSRIEDQAYQGHAYRRETKPDQNRCRQRRRSAEATGALDQEDKGPAQA
jgi:hypothetical protein